MPYLFLIALTLLPLTVMKSDVKLLRKHELNYVILFSIILIFTFFYGLRYNVGIDYMTYYRNAEQKIYDLPQKGTGELFEPAFRFLYRAADFLALPPNTIFLFGGFVMYVFLFFGIQAYSKNFAASLFIFFSSGLFFFSFNEFRQFIAVCIIFAGYRYCVSRKFIQWCAMVFLAYLFHHSSLIAFPMYFLSFIHLTKRKINILIVVSLIMKKIGALETLCLILSYLPGYFRNYAKVLPYMITEGSSGIIGYTYLLIIFLMANFSHYAIKSSEENFFFKLFIFSSFFQNIFYNVYLVGRLMEYFSISMLVIYPIFYERSKKKMITYILFLGISSLFLLNLLKYMFFPPADSLLHYQTVFSR
ncbi:MAG: EpsG family protein [Treponema sp.]|nr:EpsG family protein [Treponema sp.]